MNPVEKLKFIQETLGIKNDGIPGPITESTFANLLNEVRVARGAMSPEVHVVKASSFADAADLAAFKKAKAAGKSDEEAFKVGDNCIGKWGDFTGDEDGVPMCALPPEMWERFGEAARGKKVILNANNHTIICELRDTMPHLDHIKNGAGIDLNPAAVKAIGLKAPIMIPATWRWA